MDGRASRTLVRWSVPAALAVVLVALPPPEAPAAAGIVAGATSAAAMATPLATARDDATGRFVPVAPQRILDTRAGVGAPQGRPAAGALVDLDVTGVGGVPSDGVTAVVLNLTVTEPRQVGYVQAVPAGTGRPGASSNLNVHRVPQTVSNLVTVQVGEGGRISLHDVAGGHLVADVLGYFERSARSADGRYQSLEPTRVLDTRDGTGLGPGPSTSAARPAGGESVPVRLAGRAGIPATGAAAAAVTVTATQSSAAGFVQVVPSGGPTAPGTTSNLNLDGPDETVATLVLVPLGADGGIDLYTSSGTHLVVDVVGWFTDRTAAEAATGLFVPVAPDRLSDSRTVEPVTAGARAIVRSLGRAGVPPEGVSAAFLNVTATGTAAPGYLQVLPSDRGTRGATSNVNFTGADQTVAVAAIGTLGAAGHVSVYTPTRTHLVVDVFGYFTGSSTRATGDALLTELVVAPPETTVPYDEDAWEHWTDDDGDCQDTRDEVLIAESVLPVTLDETGCEVVDGMWNDPYLGRRHPLSAVTVDHLVPLANAHRSGAWAWDADTKKRYANDLTHPGHLLAVEASGSDAKGDAGPERWRPTTSQWCGYATDWATIKDTWMLTVTQAEHAALGEMLAACVHPIESVQVFGESTTTTADGCLETRTQVLASTSDAAHPGYFAPGVVYSRIHHDVCTDRRYGVEGRGPAAILEGDEGAVRVVATLPLTDPFTETGEPTGEVLHLDLTATATGEIVRSTTDTSPGMPGDEHLPWLRSRITEADASVTGTVPLERGQVSTSSTLICTVERCGAR